MLPLLGHAIILALWWLLMRWERRARDQHRAAMDAFAATVRALNAEHAANNAAFLRAVEGLSAARVLPTYRPTARPS